jgi:hypothetical protein
VHCNNLYNREKRNSYDQINQATTTLDRHLDNQAKREIHIKSNNITLDIRSILWLNTYAVKVQRGFASAFTND